MDTVFKTVANNLKGNIINDICSIILAEQFVKDWIIQTIQKRLFQTGKDNKGNELNTDTALWQKTDFYSNNTKAIKKSKGQKISNVTLFDTGDFYDSFQIAEKKTFIELKANFNKPDGNIFENFTKSYSNFTDFETAILSLSDEEMDLFITEIFLPRLVSNLQYQMLKNV